MRRESFCLKTRQTTTGTSVYVCPGRRHEQISGQSPLQVKVTKNVGGPCIAAIVNASAI